MFANTVRIWISMYKSTTHTTKIKKINGKAKAPGSNKVKLWYPRAVVYDPLKAGSIDGTDREPHDKAIIRAMNATYKPNHKMKGISENTIFVARLNRKTTEKTLRREFSKYGDIVRIRLVRDIITNISRGYAFIEFKSEKEAEFAIQRADKSVIDEKTILVDFECEELLPGWIPRRLGGGFGGKKESGQLRFGGRDKPFVKPISLMDEKELKYQFESKKSYF